MINEIAELEKICQSCNYIDPWTGSSMCGDCVIWRKLQNLKYERKVKGESSEFGKLLNDVSSQFGLHSRQIYNLVKILQRRYFAGGKETPLSALKRLSKALESQEYLE